MNSNYDRDSIKYKIFTNIEELRYYLQIHTYDIDEILRLLSSIVENTQKIIAIDKNLNFYKEN